jgi:SAM-dependent methyltransferase
MLLGWGVEPAGRRVLDLGCGCGGQSIALAELGSDCLAVDRNERSLHEGLRLAAQRGVQVQFLAADVLSLGLASEGFDLVIMSEILEHLGNLANVERLLRWCRERMAPRGNLYTSFPSWLNPFGGHQSGWPGIRRVPWYHLLPDSTKRWLTPADAPRYIEFAKELNHLTIRAFERAVAWTGLAVSRREFYQLRPEWRLRYGLPAARLPFLQRIPMIRECLTSGAYYLLN